MHNEVFERKISLLDWGIVISSILLLLTLYLPQIIWEEEAKFRQESRHRMMAIANAEEFYFEMVGNYTMDGIHLFELVEAAMDSLIADSLFVGNQIINLNGLEYTVNMDRGLEVRIDTTFSSPTELYFSYDDTIYTVGMKNPKSGGTDTMFVNVKNLEEYKNDEYFQAVFAYDIVSRTELRTDYLREKYHLNSNMLYCPLTNESYIFEIDTTDEESVFIVKSPLQNLEEPYKESRYGVFTFEAGNHGFIRNNQKSWAD